MGELIKLQLDGCESIGDRVEFTAEVSDFVHSVPVLVCHAARMAEVGCRIVNDRPDVGGRLMERTGARCPTSPAVPFAGLRAAKWWLAV